METQLIITFPLVLLNIHYANLLIMGGAYQYFSINAIEYFVIN